MPHKRLPKGHKPQGVQGDGSSSKRKRSSDVDNDQVEAKKGKMIEKGFRLSYVAGGHVLYPGRAKSSKVSWLRYYEQILEIAQKQLEDSVSNATSKKPRVRKKALGKCDALRKIVMTVQRLFDIENRVPNVEGVIRDDFESAIDFCKRALSHTTDKNLRQRLETFINEESGNHEAQETKPQQLDPLPLSTLMTGMSENEEDKSEDENIEIKDAFKQPVFPASEYDEVFFGAEEQTSVVGSGIRSLLKKRKSLGDPSPAKSSMHESAGEVIPVQGFVAEEIKNTIIEAPNQISEDGVPWIPKESRGHMHHLKPIFRLHNEIVHFTKFISERPHENKARAKDVETIREVVTEIWPESRMEVFGSFANNLCIPMSDVDVVLFEVPDNAIFKLSKALRKKGLVQDMEVIATARIPIIKLRLVESKYTIDISFGIPGGIETGKMIRKLLREMPALRPLVIVVKFFLCQRDMNEPYKGGIGSHLCLCLVISLLQQFRKETLMNMRNPSERVENLEDLGVLLVEFFDLYGRRFNYANVGISLRNGGSYLVKRTNSGNQRRPGLLYVENPEDPSQDLGTSSYNVPRIRTAFAHAQRLLVDRLSEVDKAIKENKQPPRSILEAIINVTDDLSARGRM